MSHRIPLHTADKLERALDAQLQRAAARGAKGWVMRIVAFFACQYAYAVIELLEGLLAEYRAGTLVFPEVADASSTMSPDHETGEQQTAASRSRGPAVRRERDPRRAPASATYRDPVGEAEHSATRHIAPTSRGPAFTLLTSRLPVRRPGPAPRGVAGYPSAVPRWPLAAFGGVTAAPAHAYFVTLPNRSANSQPPSPCPPAPFGLDTALPASREE